MIEIGKYYKHNKYHSFIKVECFDTFGFIGLCFYKNEKEFVGIGDGNIIETQNYNKITESEFLKEYKIIEDLIKKRLPICTPKNQ